MFKFLTNLTSKPQKGKIIELICRSNKKYDCDVIFLVQYLGNQRGAGLSWERWNKWNKGESMIFPKKPQNEFLRFFFMKI